MEKLTFNTLYFEITHFCNQSCKHCYLDCSIHKTLYEMDTIDIKDMITKFKTQGGRFITITGGEPFARKDIFEILDHIEKLKINFLVATNGLLMTEDRVKRLAEYKYLKFIHTSILGSEENEHNYITNSIGYKKTLNALGLFTKYNIKSVVQITLSKNIIYKAMKIANKLSEYNCIMKFTPIADLGIKNNEQLYKELVLLEEEYPKFLYEYEKIKDKYGDRVDAHNLLTYKEIENAVEMYKDKPLYTLSDGMLVVRPNGDKSFSFGITKLKAFGSVKEGIEIVVDEMLMNYIQELRDIDMKILEKYKEGQVINYYDSRENMVDV